MTKKEQEQVYVYFFNDFPALDPRSFQSIRELLHCILLNKFAYVSPLLSIFVAYV